MKKILIKTEMMNKYYERQTELLCYLNDNMVQPTEHTKSIAEIFDITFIDSDDMQGWVLIEID